MFVSVFCTGPAATNSILLACEKTKQAAIIDAPKEVLSELIPVIQQHGFQPKYLLLTHSHWDHTADAAEIKKTFSIPLYVHRLDAPNVENPGSDQLPMLIEIPKAQVDKYLEDNQTLSLGELTLTVLHTPGHTPGGVCFYLKDHHLLISGDTLFKGSIGNISFPTAEPEKMWTSLEKLAKLPPDTQIIPGHGPATTIGGETWLKQAKEYFGG